MPTGLLLLIYIHKKLSPPISLQSAMDDEREAFVFNPKHNSPQILKILEPLKQASHELHKNPNPDSPAIKPLLDLTLSTDPHLTTLSTHLTALKALTNRQQQTGLKSFITRRVNSLEISRLAESIESEIDAWIDREFVKTLTQTLRRAGETKDEVLIDLMEQFEDRIARGFDRKLQDSILRSKVFTELETVLCGSEYSRNIREAAAFVITELIKFNKDVFVGQVLIGKTVRAMISLGSVRSIQALTMLIRLIKSPIIDIIEFNGEIANIINLLNCEDVSIRAMALDCVLEIGYFGRTDAIDAMLKEDLVKKLLDFQIYNNNNSDSNSNSDSNDTEKHQHRVLSHVARFAVQIEVGEGLRQREKRALKQEVLTRVREACVCDAEAATIIAEILWGASP